MESRGLSLLSSAASFGIGQYFGSVTTIGKELLRAGAHGAASGVLSMLDGGNLASGFLSGATASGIGSYAQCVNMKYELMITSSSLIGGAVAWATGGDFLQGAMQGMSIAGLNHGFHDGISDEEKDKILTRARIRNDPDFKEKILLDIQKDGVLTFNEAYYWYVYGDGTTIEVEASKLNLGRIDTRGLKKAIPRVFRPSL